MTETARIHLRRSKGLLTVTLDSPHNRNALSGELLDRLEAALAGVAEDEDVRVVVLTGAGPAFCSGADLKSTGTAQTIAFTRILEQIMRLPQPVVCRLNGPARAGGVGLMAACDVVVAPSSATFAFTEVRLGVVPAMIMVPLLQRVDRMWLLDRCLTAESFDAAEAARAGLVNRVVDDAALDTEVERIVDLLVHGGPQALALTKQLLRDVDGERVANRLEHLRLLSAERFASAEAAEGIGAWVAKRPARWVEGNGHP
jgi:methylglutaconyl-CoA hydratase